MCKKLNFVKSLKTGEVAYIFFKKVLPQVSNYLDKFIHM